MCIQGSMIEANGTKATKGWINATNENYAETKNHHISNGMLFHNNKYGLLTFLLWMLRDHRDFGEIL